MKTYQKYSSFVILFLLSGCSTFMKWDNLPTSKEHETTIFVVNHGWHTGIVIEGSHLGSELSFLEEHFGKSNYYEFGWGDKGFYEAKEITSKITMRAIFWPTQSVMHIVSLPVEPQHYFPHSSTTAVNISTNGLAKLKSALAASFKKENQDVVRTKNGLYGTSLFFEGVGKYYITNTCNTWTAKMLKTTGAPVSSFLTLTASSVMSQSESAISKYVCCPQLPH